MKVSKTYAVKSVTQRQDGGWLIVANNGREIINGVSLVPLRIGQRVRLDGGKVVAA
jgi:hypothetical protein